MRLAPTGDGGYRLVPPCPTGCGYPPISGELPCPTCRIGGVSPVLAASLAALRRVSTPHSSRSHNRLPPCAHVGPGDYCPDCSRGDEAWWAEWVELEIRQAGQVVRERARRRINGLIREMIREPGGAPRQSKNRIFRFGRSRGWAWDSASMEFVEPPDRSAA